MKSVLISINPKWCELIASGKKTIEVRKFAPKEAPFKCYIYCTKPNTKNPWELLELHKKSEILKMNGKVIGEFICDCVTPLYNVCTDDWGRLLGGLHYIEKQIVRDACLTEKQIHDYAKGKIPLYAWFITNLVIYDKPRELSEFETLQKCDGCKSGYCVSACKYDEDCRVPTAVTRPPQSWMYAEERHGAQ